MAKTLKKLSGRTIDDRMYDLNCDMELERLRHEATVEEVNKRIKDLQLRCSHSYYIPIGSKQSKCSHCGAYKND